MPGMNAKIVMAAGALALLALAARRPAPPGAPIAPASAKPAGSARFTPRRPPAPAAAVVYVAGAVARPGLYTLAPGARAAQAVSDAGGFTPAADSAGVNLAERVSDGEEIRVPRVGERTPRPSLRSRSRARKSAAPHSVDLNQADAASLALLPGVGTALAQRIVEFRAVNGAFASVDELADVAGITPRRADALAAYVYVQDGR